MRVTIPTESPEEVRALLGINDGNARLFRKLLNVVVILRKGELQLDGEDKNVESARQVAEEVIAHYRRTGNVDGKEVEVMLVGATRDQPSVSTIRSIIINRSHRSVVPRTKGQREYVDAMQEHDVVFAIGPAGTGKTYLAIASAIDALESESVRRIILVRPAVEAGERLGFLPGDMSQKIDPYLRPMYDALHDMLGAEQVGRLIEKNLIEIAPLAFMRGRSLNDSFVILDEAQNTSVAQMKMFLTRIGFGSHAVVTGDITQIDLPSEQQSGLKNAAKILSEVEGVGFTYFTPGDIVRHELVQRIVEAYETDGNGGSGS